MDYKRLIYIASIIVAFGVVLTTTLKGTIQPVGIIMIGVGGLFFIVGMNKKRQEESNK